MRQPGLMEIDAFYLIYLGRKKWAFYASIYPKIDAFYLIYLHGTLIGTCGFVPCELKTNPYASARKSCSVLVF